MSMLIACDAPGCTSLPIHTGDEESNYQIAKIGDFGYVQHFCCKECLLDFIHQHLETFETTLALPPDPTH